MKTKKTIMTLMFTASVMALSLNACKKSGDATSGTSDTAAISASSSATASEMVFDDSFDVVTQSSEQSNLSVNSTGGTITTNSLTAQNASFTTTAGATITVVPADPSVFPKTMTIDYRTGVTSPNGVVRKGQIIVNLTGEIRVAGSVISVTYNNYSVNGYQINGTYAMTPKLVAGAGVNYNITVSNGSITQPDGTTATYSGTETFTQVAGIGTSTITDDTYQVTGNFSYHNTSTGTITANITNPLVKSTDCKDITSGTIAFTDNKLKGTLDFGPGTCDNLATITFGVTTQTITLAR
ncbi:hypothetical protein [Mucilaginibacter gotjawali]|uniref:Uncharacterized protein n=2 Tax=Mucilaginibacter gotjawali TaxID=1550579 RepID=A0A0X8X4Y4_9SPHI|nr:hypothetical protein [Mucilaginibacter gotjawali]MBB3056000.1 hypothetical protein [Mucilaginibacter gotjawali]BAU53664.1 hypothetical protein MgSA37_01833 [Mucilaginibacter gotjawali]